MRRHLAQLRCRRSYIPAHFSPDASRTLANLHGVDALEPILDRYGRAQAKPIDSKDAITKLRHMLGGEHGLGHVSAKRHIAYCVLGKTSAEIAKACGLEDRVVTAILALDLKACAKTLRRS